MKSALSFLFIFALLPGLVAAETLSVRTPDLEIFFLPSQQQASQEVASLYPAVRQELEQDFGWKIDFRPAVVLADNTDRFRAITGSDVVIALAVPARNLIVLDTARVYTKPFTLKTTLKHEMCHLLMHRHIESGNLPRWLDEGICQWASGGISELMAGPGGGELSKAVIADRLYGMRRLGRFPADEQSLLLAYEESRSFIEFIESRFGRQGILSLLHSLKDSRSVDEAITETFGTSLAELDSEWRAHLKTRHTWISYLSYHIDILLFAFAALVMIAGFFRFLKRKRAYRDDEEDNGLGKEETP
ncbi:MAG: peptidase MA family metallohydrolase [Nitrospirota bacterium]